MCCAAHSPCRDSLCFTLSKPVIGLRAAGSCELMQRTDTRAAAAGDGVQRRSMFRQTTVQASERR
jgi:hypothetical protein